MEFEPEDQDIVSLLTTLKDSEGTYPEHMFVARRQMFLEQLADVGMGIGTDAGIGGPTSPNPPPVAPFGSTLLEAALVFAIIVEASAVAYFYRDRLADFFQTITAEPRVQEVSSLPIVATAVEIEGMTLAPAVTSTMPSATLAPSASPTGIIATPSSTALPGVADESNEFNNTSGAGISPMGSTPLPSSNTEGPGDTVVQTPEPERTKENSGNHYGQTPKPERTKENNGNNDKLPKD